MPELPEVETVRLGLVPVMVGYRFLEVEQRRADLRFPLPADFANRLQGRQVTRLRRRAKYILTDLEDGYCLVSHLGMSGSFRIDDKTTGGPYYPQGILPRHDHLIWHLSNGKTITYNDPRRFGFMDLIKQNQLENHPWFKSLGIEPLGLKDGKAALLAGFSRKKAPLKAALLDQRIIAGLGNIYVCEALFRAHLSPLRKASTLNPQEANLLWHAIDTVLHEALAAGGSSLKDHRRTDGSLGYFQHRFQVYDREGKACLTEGCRGIVLRITQAGRSSFFCPECQCNSEADLGAKVYGMKSL